MDPPSFRLIYHIQSAPIQKDTGGYRWALPRERRSKTRASGTGEPAATARIESRAGVPTDFPDRGPGAGSASEPISRSSRPLRAPPIRRPNEPGPTLPMSASQTISLLPAVSEGNLAAFEQLYDRHSPILYALLLRMLANPEDAQEVLQEAFVKAWN